MKTAGAGVKNAYVSKNTSKELAFVMGNEEEIKLTIRVRTLLKQIA